MMMSYMLIENNKFLRSFCPGVKFANLVMTNAYVFYKFTQ